MSCPYYSSNGTYGSCSKKRAAGKQEAHRRTSFNSESYLEWSEKQDNKCSNEHYNTHCPYLNGNRYSNGCSFYSDNPGCYGHCCKKQELIRLKSGRGISYKSDGELTRDEHKNNSCPNPGFNKGCPYRHGKLGDGGNRGEGNGAPDSNPVHNPEPTSGGLYGLDKFLMIGFVVLLIYSAGLLLGEKTGFFRPRVTYSITSAETLNEIDRPKHLVLSSQDSKWEYKLDMQNNTRFRKEVRGAEYGAHLELDGEDILVGYLSAHVDGYSEATQQCYYEQSAEELKNLSGYVLIIDFKDSSGAVPKIGNIMVTGDYFEEYSCLPYGGDGRYILDLWAPDAKVQTIKLQVDSYATIELNVDFSKKRVQKTEVILK